jgi:hypothetical protein
MAEPSRGLEPQRTSIKDQDTRAELEERGNPFPFVLIKISAGDRLSVSVHGACATWVGCTLQRDSGVSHTSK